MAKAGEFTMRAFMNGRIDLSQAESIADLIASENEASRKVALQQLKGGISQEISVLRNDLLNFVSLIELELDFADIGFRINHGHKGVGTNKFTANKHKFFRRHTKVT